MKIYSVVSGLLFLISATAAFANTLCKSQKYPSIKAQLANLSPSTDLDLFDFELFKNGSVVSGYEYEVDPAYTKGLYSRKDRWQIGANLTPGTAVKINDKLDVNLGIGPKFGVEATFIRFFHDPCKAVFSIPYSPRRSPLKTKIALSNKFNKGDYFLFRASSGLVVSADVLNILSSSTVGLGVSGSYLMDGYYQLHIVRLDEKHIRMKVLGHRGKSVSAGLNIGLNTDFDVFKVSVLDDGIENVVSTKPLKVSTTYKKSKVFMVDYTLDLTDPEVSAAYEKVIKKVTKFKDIEFTKIFKDFGRQGGPILDITPLEELYRHDYSSQNLNRITRYLKTSSEQDAFGFSLHAGNKILGFKVGRGNSTSRMSINRADDALERFLLRSWEESSEGRYLYTVQRSQKKEGLRALFSADNKFNELVPINIIKFMKHTKTRFSYKDFLELRMMLKKILPEEMFGAIPWNQWKQSQHKKVLNYGLRFELLMSPESILNLPELSLEEISVFFRDFLLRKGLKETDFFSDRSEYDSTGRPTRRISGKLIFSSSLKQMSELLSSVLNQKLSMLERLKQLTNLRKNQLFSETGIGFIISLRPDHMAEWNHLDLNISSNESVIDFSYGDVSLSALYKKILTIKAALDDDAFDLLREAEAHSVPEDGVILEG
jgi:hypothetical protein